MRLVDQAHLLIGEYLKAGDVAIDATIGNGLDTAYLAERVGAEGKVFGFDVQEMAIEVATLILKTKRLLNQCELFQEGHETLSTCIPEVYRGRVTVAMFNLGYLPHGDKSIVTQSDTTLAALEQSLMLLAPDGLISILAYRGHPGGMDEYEAVANWIAGRSEELKVIRQEDSDHPEDKGPYLWLLRKQPS